MILQHLIELQFKLRILSLRWRNGVSLAKLLSLDSVFIFLLLKLKIHFSEKVLHVNRIFVVGR